MTSSRHEIAAVSRSHLGTWSSSSALLVGAASGRGEAMGARALLPGAYFGGSSARVCLGWGGTSSFGCILVGSCGSRVGVAVLPSCHADSRGPFGPPAD